MPELLCVESPNVFTRIQLKLSYVRKIFLYFLTYGILSIFVFFT